ncbi:MAG TPA: anaerobic ribonucleoside-triphosphate reductase activating protein [Candidatus Syntrophosphaera sp.]|nr:anaerobic ribonucleoside-triphosphate reductase activating protein [Candidatus Syntrophosphaera sp.]
MKIGGFHKFSMLDYPGQLAAIVFAQGCNFRCPYCHNPQLVDPLRFSKPLRNSRILDFLARRKGRLGAVVISGGEPTCQPDLVDFVRQLKALGYLVKIDTNGSLPEVIGALASESLVDYWAMDLKAPLDMYAALTKTTIPVNHILKSMDIIRSSKKEYEFRTTYFERLFDFGDILRIQELLVSGDRYVLQECRYGDTLEDLSALPAPALPAESSSFMHLRDNPACKSLLRWGDRHQVSIRIRSL